MPIKLKPSQKSISKITGKSTVKHFYLKMMRFKELESIVNDPRTKPKVKDKCKKEIVRRYKN